MLPPLSLGMSAGTAGAAGVTGVTGVTLLFAWSITLIFIS
jgi:hypothetical protein